MWDGWDSLMESHVYHCTMYMPILCVRPIPLSYMGQMGQSYGIPCVPLYKPILHVHVCVRPIPLSYMGLMGQSYGIPCVPLYKPILHVCVRPIPLSYMVQMGQSGVPQPVAIIAIGEDANNLAITRRQQEP